jgi:peptide/nickel transport system substrate-binding protein
MVYPIPVQDVQRVESNATTSAMTGPELRTIFLGMDQHRDELTDSNVKGKNPFKDVRVRKAFYQAINMDAIRDKVMRGMSNPTSLLISPLLYSRSDEFERYPYDPEASKKLLAEAGYPDGFSVTMDCPNDRYVNDEAICQTVAAFLARVGVKINLNAQPKAQYFAKVLASNNYNTSFYLLGWTPSSFDSWNVLHNITGCRDEKGKGGPFNLGGYCSKEVDALAAEILKENDKTKRDDLIAQAFTILHNEVSHIPLHQQSLAWGVSDKLSLVQRADNQFIFRWVVKK